MKRIIDINSGAEKDDPVFFPEWEKEFRQHPFVAPEGYFNRLPSVIGEKVAAVKDKQRKFSIAGWLLKPAYRFALASILVGLIIGSVYFFHVRKSQPENLAITWEDVMLEEPGFLNSISETAVIDFVVNQMKVSGLAAGTIDSVLNGDVAIPDEDLIEYLDNENNLDNVLFEL